MLYIGLKDPVWRIRENKVGRKYIIIVLISIRFKICCYRMQFRRRLSDRTNRTVRHEQHMKYVSWLFRNGRKGHSIYVNAKS